MQQVPWNFYKKTLEQRVPNLYNGFVLSLSRATTKLICINCLEGLWEISRWYLRTATVHHDWDWLLFRIGSDLRFFARTGLFVWVWSWRYFLVAKISVLKRLFSSSIGTHYTRSVLLRFSGPGPELDPVAIQQKNTLFNTYPDPGT